MAQAAAGEHGVGLGDQLGTAGEGLCGGYRLGLLTTEERHGQIYVAGATSRATSGFARFGKRERNLMVGFSIRCHEASPTR